MPCLRLSEALFRSSALAAAVCITALGGCGQAHQGAGDSSSGLGLGAREPAPGDTEHLATMMVGSYSSAAQAAADPEFRDIRLAMVRIWPARTDGPWLYIEQAAATATDKPYRQRVYRLEAAGDPESPDRLLESHVYELPGDPLAFAGAWTEPSRFEVLTPNDLLEREGCTVYLEATADGSYEGSTRDADCLSTLRGAAYATSEVVITADEIRSWDRGFDKEGKQVWGAVKGPYQFLKLSAEEAKAAARAPASSRAEPSSSSNQGRDIAQPMGVR